MDTNEIKLVDWNKITSKKYDEKETIPFDTAKALLYFYGGYGDTRIYATYLDGVFKGQITSVKSQTMLDELISAYNVQLWAATTTIQDLVKKA